MLLKDDLVDYLTQGYIHVSRQDYLFFSNLAKIANERNVTTGQNNLLNKLLVKYQKQLRNNNLDIEILKNLSWKNPLLETLDEYRKTYINLTDQEITVRNPFSKKFISALQKSNSELVWDKKRKCYSAEYNTYNLKHTLDVVFKNFDDVVLSNNIQQLLNDIKQYENCHWNPTLVKSNENFYIAAANEYLMNNLNFELNDQPKTLFNLNRYGVQVDETLQSSEENKFASSHIYHIDIADIDLLIELLTKLEINTVEIEGHALYRDSIYKELRNKLIDHDIKIRNENDTDPMPVLLTFKASNVFWKSKKASKIILIKNGRPISIL